MRNPDLAAIWGDWSEVLTPERALVVGRVLLQVLVILLVTAVAVRLATYAINRSVAGYRKHSLSRNNGGRVETMGALLRSLVRYVLYFVGALWVLDAVGIPAGTVIATAGIGGIAIGFGAQNLVRDIISGFFILMENQYEVGEFVTIDGVSGVVAEVGLRSTRIQAYSGDQHFVPNGNILKVTNHSRSNMQSLIDISIGYDEDHNRAIAVATEALEAFRQTVDYITDGPKVWGIQDLASSGVVLRVWAKAVNGKQWALEREMRRILKEAFQREGIEIPFPHQVVIMRNSGPGSSKDE